MEKEQRHIKEFEQLRSIAGSNLNILEEEIDIQVQKEYFSLLRQLGKQPEIYTQLTKEYIENINNLFDDNIDLDIKKKMLVILASVDDVSTYRAIEQFSKQPSALQKWAIIALQQARILLQSSLLDDPGFYISTGLGGQGSLLRYFCVFPYRTEVILPEFQKKILQDELTSTVQQVQGSVEEIEFQEHFATALVLLSLQTDIPHIFSDIIDECNLYGNFLLENVMITNVKKLTTIEILDSLNSKSNLKG